MKNNNVRIVRVMFACNLDEVLRHFYVSKNTSKTKYKFSNYCPTR